MRKHQQHLIFIKANTGGLIFSGVLLFSYPVDRNCVFQFICIRNAPAYGTQHGARTSHPKSIKKNANNPYINTDLFYTNKTSYFGCFIPLERNPIYDR